MYDRGGLPGLPAATVYTVGGIYGDASTKSPDPRAPIDAGLTSLQDRVESLFKLVSALDNRFSAVLRPAPPATAAPNRPLDIIAGSPIGGLLSDRIGQLRDLEMRLEDLLSRCEL